MLPNLKTARQGSIEDFIKEHEVDPDGDLDKLDAVIKRPVQGNEKATRPASPQGVVRRLKRYSNSLT
jgi:5,10-methylene-tetrahydrofolate dehydrogenase/methenyl tetrahydrofolate cyclohydrolase